MAGVALKEEQINALLDALYNAFGLQPFTVQMACAKIGVSSPTIIYALKRSKGRTRMIASFTEIAEWRGDNKSSYNWHTFDRDLKKAEFLNSFDPIPINERTLQPQLFGEYAVRLREVRDYIWRHKLPPFPTDRPLDFWELGVFQKRPTTLYKKEIYNGFHYNRPDD